MSLTKTLFIYTETSLHAGTGTGLGAVDLPIQREITTGFPMIQGSGVKGAIRSQITGEKSDAVSVVFGPFESPDFAGAASFGDARILAFPVRSLRGVFAWITCPTVLARFKRDLGSTFTDGRKMPKLPNDPELEVEVNGRTLTQAFVSSDSIVIDGEIVLEEYLYSAQIAGLDDPARKWAIWLKQNAIPDADDDVYSYYQDAIRDRLVILRDDDFRDFVMYSTQVNTRIRLDPDTKTVANGMLFTQELLPPETILYVPVTALRPRASSDLLESAGMDAARGAEGIMTWLTNGENVPGRIQIGADETVGYGFVALTWGGVDHDASSD